ncbi:DUF3140 domain-containing protein [Tellurirhabdus bombi]|uniref:DUF3140 domain-containing protein n=1 Tax=Tellurirhabdus bombi TaxID=2907205 RepID=UPI001F40F9D8|nr:DUF3140 domain-containing protein [Tellurirhabdus bombi]
MTDQEKKEVLDEFDELTNMSASELKKWLETDDSKSVGQDSGDGESIGHKSGEKIITIKQKKNSELANPDYEHMRKVISYIKRHNAQRPKDVRGSNWAFSLKNWGHDPEK